MPELDVNAIHEKDLQGFLEKLGLSKQFQEGQIKCYVCGDVLSLENLGAILSVKGEARFVCTKPECYEKALPKPA